MSTPSLQANSRGATSLVVQWLRCPTSTIGGADSNTGQGNKIPYAAVKKKKKKVNKRQRKCPTSYPHPPPNWDKAQQF